MKTKGTHDCTKAAAMSSQLNMSYRKNLLSQLSSLFDDDTSHSSVGYKSSLDDEINRESKVSKTIVSDHLQNNKTRKEYFTNGGKIEIHDQQIEIDDNQQIKANNYNQQIAEREHIQQIVEKGDEQEMEENEDQPINMKEKRDRDDSIEEIQPDDPFGDILEEEIMIDLKVELEVIKEEPLQYEAGENCGMADYSEDEVVQEKKPNKALNNQKRPIISNKNSNFERSVQMPEIKNVLPAGDRKLRPKKTSNPEEKTKEITEIRETTAFWQDHRTTGYPSSVSKNYCKVCGITFIKKSDLKKHIAKNPKEILVCSICSKIFKGNHILNLHLVTKHDVRPKEFIFLCHRCPSKFYNTASRNLHLIFKHKTSDLKYKCGFCSRSYIRKKSYLNHVYGHTVRKNGILYNVAKEESKTLFKDKVFHCGECKALYLNEISLLKHMSAVHKVSGLSSEMTECEQCGLTLTSARNLGRHIKNVHSDSTFNCWKCDASYKNTDALRKHLQRNHSEKHSKIINDEQELKCIECGSIFTSSYVTSAWMRLKEHTHRKHTGVNAAESGEVLEKPLVAECQQCGKLCTENNFYEHTKEEHKQPSTLQRCTKCVYKTYDASLFAEHEKVHTDGEQIYKCWYEGCDYVSAKEKNLDKHIFHQHEEAVKCVLCPFETKNSLLMKNHIQGHETGSYESDNVSPFDQHKDGDTFKCELCDYATSFFSALWIHKRNHADASTEKLIKCNKCPYVTHLYDNMKRHYSTHSGRTYKCFLCPFQTKYPNSVETHKKLKHPNVQRTKYQCDLCSFSSLYRAYLIVHKQVKHKSKAKCVNTKEQYDDKSYTAAVVKIEDPVTDET